MSENATTRKTGKASGGFSAEERAAMKERAREVKAESRRTSKAEKAAAAERAVIEAIADMPEPDRVLAERVHEIIRATAPDLAPKTWYGMPAYARDGKVVCFFQSAAKFEARYATIGFNDTANLDDGAMWPISFALTTITAAEEARITDLVRKAVS